MKKAIKILIIIVIIIAGIVAFINIKNKKEDYTYGKISEYNFFNFKQGDKFGVINKEGKIIIDANYDDVIIPNPEKALFICQNEQNVVILNSNNEELFKNYEEVTPIKLKNVATALAFEKNVLKYKKDGLYGLIDFEENIITKNLYTSIENLQPTEGMFLVEKDNKKGVVDFKGKTLVDTKYDNVLSDEYYTEEELYKKSGFIVENKTDDGYRYGYINYNGKKILDNKYNQINRVQKEDKDIFLIVSENGKYGLYKNSKKVIDHEYTSINYDDNIELVIVEKNKKYGVDTLKRKKYYKNRK